MITRLTLLRLTTLTLTELMILVFAREIFLADDMTNILEGAVSCKVALFTAGKTAFSRAVPRGYFLAVAWELAFAHSSRFASQGANCTNSVSAS